MAADNAEMQLMIPHCRQREEQEGEGQAGKERETAGRRKIRCADLETRLLFKYVRLIAGYMPILVETHFMAVSALNGSTDVGLCCHVSL